MNRRIALKAMMLAPISLCASTTLDAKESLELDDIRPQSFSHTAYHNTQIAVFNFSKKEPFELFKTKTNKSEINIHKGGKVYSSFDLAKINYPFCLTSKIEDAIVVVGNKKIIDNLIYKKIDYRLNEKGIYVNGYVQEIVGDYKEKPVEHLIIKYTLDADGSILQIAQKHNAD